jgi:hypothetical protein
MLVVLTGIAMVLVAPITTSDASFPEPTIRFWWARIAPRSYALHTLRTARYFAAIDAPQICVHPEDLYQAWTTILAAPDAEARFTELFGTASPAGRLYAVTGLAAVRSPHLADAVASSQRDTSGVLFTSNLGVRPTVTQVKALVSDTAARSWATTVRAAVMRKCAA